MTAADAVRRKLDAKTKPRGSLGRLEELALRLASAHGEEREVAPAIVVAAADHGVAAEGVSAYPAEVTAQMLANFAAGGAAVCVLARAVAAELRVVDAGVGRPTENIAVGPAMTRPAADALVARGRALAEELAADGVTVVGLGDMGIGNTTSASALCAALLPARAADVCGRGTGLDDVGLARKVAVVERALAANPHRCDPLDVLAALGGSEIAFLVGLTLGAAANRVAVLVDGFITSAAALVATRVESSVGAVLIASHLSPEPGHRLVLDALGLEPLLDLGLRLGEGTGAALAVPLLRAARAIVDEMATFEQAGVTDAGR